MGVGWAIAATVLVFAPAASDGPVVRVRWEGAGVCAEAEPMRTRLRELLPGIAFDDAAAIDVSVEVNATAKGWTVDVAIASEWGLDRRSFVAESCEVATEASALVVAVALDPILAAQEVERMRTSVAEPVEPEPVEPEPAEPEPEPELSLTLSPTEPEPEPRRRRLGAGLAVLGGGGYGPLQAGAAALSVRAALLGPRFRWELRGIWLPPIAVAVDETRSIRFDGWQLGTRGCGLPRLGERTRIELPLCVGIEAGAIRGTPLDPIVNKRVASQPWVAAELGPGLVWVPRPRLALGLEVAAVVPFVAAGFSLDDQPVLGYAPVGVRALAGIELRLP